jgi:hypothetical protein
LKSDLSLFFCDDDDYDDHSSMHQSPGDKPNGSDDDASPIGGDDASPIGGNDESPIVVAADDIPIPIESSS